MSYQRSRQEHKRMSRLYDQTKNTYGAGAYFNEQKNCFMRYSASNGVRSKFLKKQSNKRVRRATDLHNYAAYRRYLDYYFELL